MFAGRGLARDRNVFASTVDQGADGTARSIALENVRVGGKPPTRKRGEVD